MAAKTKARERGRHKKLNRASLSYWMYGAPLGLASKFNLSPAARAVGYGYVVSFADLLN
jgi:hypothetical protein